MMERPEPPRWRVAHGEALDLLRALPDASFHAMVTDPPAGIGFMSGYHSWDNYGSKRGTAREAFVSDMATIFAECRRVLKPGAHALVWALPKTGHWTMDALEQAGFEVREVIHHAQASGMPKTQNAARAIDAALGVEGSLGGPRPAVHAQQLGRGPRDPGVALYKKPWMDDPAACDRMQRVYEPATAEARAWDGWHTAVAPAVEWWVLVRTPLGEATIARNALAHGTGYLHVDACRVPRAEGDVPGWHASGSDHGGGFAGTRHFRGRSLSPEEIQARHGGKGGWPKSLVLEHAPECVPLGHVVARVRNGSVSGTEPSPQLSTTFGEPTTRRPFIAHGDDGGEVVARWACVPECPVRHLDAWSGTSKSRKGKPRKSKSSGEGWGMTATGSEYADAGGPSRYFNQFGGTAEASSLAYVPKPARGEKEAGLDDPTTGIDLATLNRVNPGGLENVARFAPVSVRNNHPTVKGIDLCRYLVRLVARPGQFVLDPFCGSGSIGCAAATEGIGYWGCDREERHVAIARGRITHWHAKAFPKNEEGEIER